MEYLHLFFQSVGNVVLHPTWHSAVILFITSGINEIFAMLPYSIVISSQIFFLKGEITLQLASQILFLVAVPIGLGSALGTLPFYLISYWGGYRAINKYGKYLRFSWSDVEAMNEKLKGAWYDEVIFTLWHSIPLVPSLPATILGGVVRMPFWKYFLLSFIGFVLRIVFNIALFSIGFIQLSKFASLLYNG